MANTVEVSTDLLQKMAAYVEQTSETLEAATKMQKAAAEAAPGTVDLLIKQGMLEPEVRDHAIRTLAGSHIKAIEALQKTAAQVSVPAMGSTINTEKSAGAEEIGEADRVFFETLGLQY